MSDIGNRKKGLPTEDIRKKDLIAEVATIVNKAMANILVSKETVNKDGSVTVDESFNEKAATTALKAIESLGELLGVEGKNEITNDNEISVRFSDEAEEYSK